MLHNEEKWKLQGPSTAFSSCHIVRAGHHEKQSEASVVIFVFHYHTG